MPQTVQGEGDGEEMMSEDTESRCALTLCVDLQTVIVTYVCMFIHFHDILLSYHLFHINSNTFMELLLLLCSCFFILMML